MGSDLIVLRLPFDFQHECCVQRSRVKEYEGMMSRYRRSRGEGGQCSRLAEWFVYIYALRAVRSIDKGRCATSAAVASCGW